MEDLRKVEKAIAQPIVTSAQGQNSGGNSAQNTVQSSAQKNVSRRHAIERRLAGIILWQRTLPTPQYAEGVLAEKVNAKVKEVLGSAEARDTYSTLVEQYQPEVDELIVEAELSYDKSEKLEQEIEELVTNLAEDYGKEASIQLLARIAKAEREKDSEQYQTLIVQFQELNKRLAKLQKVR